MMWPAPAFASTALALLAERYFGYPKALYRRIGHPVTWMGALLTQLETRLNTRAAEPQAGRLRGVAALAGLLAASLLPAWLVVMALIALPGGWVIEAFLATAFIAQKSMVDHVRAVRVALDSSLPEARRAVSMIVGRDPAQLDESGIARAALESLAENASDGIVAPAFWYAVGGFPALVAYKAINTADSMIGHKTDRYLYFGWAAARLDDLVNLIPARLCGLLFAAAGGNVIGCLKAMWRDAPKHKSPNAGWPESSFAEALGLQFGGPRSYAGEVVNLPTMGAGRAALTRFDIDGGLTLFDRAMWLLFGLAVIAALL
jgi:adenosylcobinamide-phosphate synthase